MFEEIALSEGFCVTPRCMCHCGVVMNMKTSKNIRKQFEIVASVVNWDQKKLCDEKKSGDEKPLAKVS
jgi:hypothetical protein